MNIGPQTLHRIARSARTRQFLRYYLGVTLSTAATSALTFISLWMALTRLSNGNISVYTVVFALPAIALLISCFVNSVAFSNALRGARGERIERRELGNFQDHSDHTIKNAIASILFKESDTLKGVLLAANGASPPSDQSSYSYPIYVFAQGMDNKFRVAAATIDSGSEHFRMAWDPTEGWFPDLLRLQCAVLYEHEGPKLSSLNGAVQLTLHEVSEFNLSKIARDFKVAIVIPITMPHQLRDEQDAGKVFGTLGIYTNNPDGAALFRDPNVETFTNRLAAEVASWVVMYKSLRDLRRRLE